MEEIKQPEKEKEGKDASYRLYPKEGSQVERSGQSSRETGQEEKWR